MIDLNFILYEHLSFNFKVIVGFNLLGDFSSVEGLTYQVPTFEYQESGRNHSAVLRPFDGPGKTGELTLRTGKVWFATMFGWLNKVKVGQDYLKNVYIIQKTRKGNPTRIYHLTGCFPINWKAGDMSVEGSAQLPTEDLTLAYDQISMTNLTMASVGIEKLMSLFASGPEGDYEARAATWGDAWDDERWNQYLADAGTWGDAWDDDRWDQHQAEAKNSWLEALPREYEAKPEDWGDEGLERLYQAVEGEWGEEEGLERTYQAQAGEFGDEEALGSDYEAESGDWGDDG